MCADVSKDATRCRLVPWFRENMNASQRMEYVNARTGAPTTRAPVGPKPVASQPVRPQGSAQEPRGKYVVQSTRSTPRTPAPAERSGAHPSDLRVGDHVRSTAFYSYEYRYWTELFGRVIKRTPTRVTVKMMIRRKVTDHLNDAGEEYAVVHKSLQFHLTAGCWEQFGEGGGFLGRHSIEDDTAPDDHSRSFRHRPDTRGESDMFDPWRYIRDHEELWDQLEYSDSEEIVSFHHY
jgi:hypothetical protein